MTDSHPLARFRQDQTPPLSQKDLAERLGVSKSAVSRWESGERAILPRQAKNIFTKTGIRESVLLGLAEDAG